MRGRKQRVFSIGRVAVIVLLSLTLVAEQVPARELRGAEEDVENRRLMSMPAWLNALFLHVSSIIGAVPTPILEKQHDTSEEENYDYQSASAEETKYKGGSKSSKGKGKKSKSKSSSRSSSKKSKQSKSSASSSSSSKPAPLPVHTPTPAPQLAPSATTEAPSGRMKEFETNSPRPTSRPNQAPSVTFAPFDTLAPSLTPMEGVTFAPFSTPAPTSAPITVGQPSTSTPVVSTIAPVMGVPDSLAPVTASTAAPTSTTAPVPQFQTVNIQPYYIAYAASAAQREPTEEEYQQMANLTTLYFEEVLGTMYSNAEPDFGVVSFTKFDSVVSSIDSTQYNAGIPEEKYNLYISFETEVVFSTESTIIPEASELFDIMQEAISPTYIVNYVWQLPESPFISTQEVLMEAVQVLEIVTASDTDFGTGGIGGDGTDDAFGVGSISGRTSTQHHDNLTFGQGLALDRDFSNSTLRERFILPGSIIKNTIFRQDDNGSTR